MVSILVFFGMDGVIALLSIRNYVSIVLIFLLIFLLFVTVALTTDSLAGADIDTLAGPEPAITAGDTPLEVLFDEGSPEHIAHADTLKNNRRAALVVSGDEDAMVELFKEWCYYNKHCYRVFTGLPAAEEIKGFDVVLFGELSLQERHVELLEDYGATGVPLVFTQLPTFQALKGSPRLAHCFGIRDCISPNYRIDGMKLFKDFFLSNERIYTHGDDYSDKEDEFSLELPYYTLRPGYEVYAVAVLHEQGEIKNEDLPPLLWRTYSGSSFVFVVNSGVFAGKSMLGVITAFLSQAGGIYLYPVINGNSIVMLNFPTFAQENEQRLMDQYMRTPQSFKRDILWPNIVKVLKNYDMSYDFFVSPRLNARGEPPLHDEDVLTYWKEIAKLGGTAGLSLEELSGMSLQQVLAFNGGFFQDALPQYRFTALYGGGYSLKELDALFKNQQDEPLEDVSLVLSDYYDEERFFQFINDRVLAIMTTMDGYRHERLDDVRMLALETALGFCIQHVNLARALFPEDAEDDWSRLAEHWSSGRTYFNDFRLFDSASIYELETRVRRFLALSYHWHAKKDLVEVGIDNLQGEAWFVLRVHHAEVAWIKGGTYKKLSPNAYLVRAEEAKVSIGLRETNYLLSPDEGWKS